MSKKIWLAAPFAVFLVVALACNAPGSGGTELSSTEVIETAVAQASTLAVGTVSTPLSPISPGEPVELPSPTDTTAPVATPTPGDPLVLHATLCWVGPGPQFEVVSALKEGERVPLLGKGSLPDWWVVRNPIYRDPCWVQASDLQVDPGVDVNALEIFYPPPTPTWTPTSTPTPTNTP